MGEPLKRSVGLLGVPMTEETPIPDPLLTSEEEQRVRQLKEHEVLEIDKALLSNARHHWQKVAMVVALTMESCAGKIPPVPDLFYGQRVRRLVEIGLLESQGDLSSMRFSEVRLSIATSQSNKALQLTAR